MAKMPNDKPKSGAEQDADPSLLAETIADAPGIDPDRAMKAARAKARNSPRDLSLDQTVYDYEAARRSSEVELDKILDKPDSTADAASMSRFDPEAGKTNVAVKIRAVTEAVKNSFDTPFGKLLLSVVFGMAGVGTTIAAITLQDTPWVVAACILMPVGLLLVYWRYQAWLGHKRYMYRLLETLGEDVTDFDPRHKYRRTGAKAVKKQ